MKLPLLILAILIGFVVIKGIQGSRFFWKWHAQHCAGCNFSHE